MKLHYSVFRCYDSPASGQRWATQVLTLPDEVVVHYSTYSSRPEAQAKLNALKHRITSKQVEAAVAKAYREDE